MSARGLLPGPWAAILSLCPHVTEAVETVSLSEVSSAFFYLVQYKILYVVQCNGVGVILNGMGKEESKEIFPI